MKLLLARKPLLLIVTVLSEILLLLLHNPTLCYFLLFTILQRVRLSRRILYIITTSCESNIIQFKISHHNDASFTVNVVHVHVTNRFLHP